MPKHGVPSTLLSDNGPEFDASVLRDAFVRAEKLENFVARHSISKGTLLLRVTCAPLRNA